ncbi:MAG TPA: phosphocarrier protein HPr [Planctomycetaceae bacterium]|nr:phosphocarrier protein HPr [Planctomycetaceae bacterium]
MPKTALKRVEEVVVNNKSGLHARISTMLAKTAMAFSSQILVHKQRDRKTADARSVLELLSLGAAKEDRIRIEAAGEDADQAMDAILELFTVRFKELDDEELD